MTFLVVDGSQEVREALCYALVAQGIKGVPAPHRSAGWELLRADPSIDGAIVDIDDAAVEGERLVSEIKADERTRGLAVIIHTRQSSRSVVLRMVEAGIAGYLLKPFKTADGPAKLARVLSRLADHDRQRRHFRVRPDADELVRVHFRLPGPHGIQAGRVIDISMGGIAVEMLRPQATDGQRRARTWMSESPPEGPELLAPGMRIEDLTIVLAPRELSAAASVVSVHGKTVAFRFDTLSPENQVSLQRYVFKKISA